MMLVPLNCARVDPALIATLRKLKPRAWARPDQSAILSPRRIGCVLRPRTLQLSKAGVLAVCIDEGERRE